MERTVIDGITLEYTVVGAGEPVVCIHGALVADTFRPLLTEPSLAAHYRLITYQRRGYGNSSRTSDSVTIAQQASDCRALLAHLEVERAQVVGHSFGGVIALQLALETPAVVHSLALIEPGLMIGACDGPYRGALARGGQRYREAGADYCRENALRAALVMVDLLVACQQKPQGAALATFVGKHSDQIDGLTERIKRA